MKRQELKTLIDVWQPSAITAGMIVDSRLRRMEMIRQRARDRYRNDMITLYRDRSLSDEQRSKGFWKASARWDAAQKKLRPLQARFDREVLIPMLRRTGVLRRISRRRMTA